MVRLLQQRNDAPCRAVIDRAIHYQVKYNQQRAPLVEGVLGG